MRAMMAFFIEFWDLGERWLESLTDDRWALDPLHGGWCIELPEGARICHLRANMGDWLADILMPRMVALGARTNDIAVINFAVWINEWHEYRDNLARFAGEQHSDRLSALVGSQKLCDRPVQSFSAMIQILCIVPWACSANGRKRK